MKINKTIKKVLFYVEFGFIGAVIGLWLSMSTFWACSVDIYDRNVYHKELPGAYEVIAEFVHLHGVSIISLAVLVGIIVGTVLCRKQRPWEWEEEKSGGIQIKDLHPRFQRRFTER